MPGSETMTFETRAKVSPGGWWGLWGANYNGQIGFGIRDAGEFVAIARYDPGSANRTTQTITGVDLTVWHTYKIIVKHTTARYYVDDELKATISENMPHNKSMPVRLDRVSWGWQTNH